CICMQIHGTLKLLNDVFLVAGTRSLVTVSEVSAKAGGSISIPCLYEPQYTSSIKYLCQTWKSEKRFMIHDDQSRQVFTVTITDLQPQDASYYWCAVRTSTPLKILKKKLNILMESVVFLSCQGVPGLHVDNQEVKGFMGEDLTISCYCSNTGESQWCRLGGPCVKGSAGEIDSTSVIINNNHDGVFTVTMKRLRTESSGWYFCASEGLQMPVHVTVEHRPPMSECSTLHLIKKPH
uniref:Ig-like domain-containing protein n=1 Tax=Salarias fasciatus TaxID=181472 RepID=A0A672GAU7_SALFA